MKILRCAVCGRFMGKNDDVISHNELDYFGNEDSYVVHKECESKIISPRIVIVKTKDLKKVTSCSTK
jgi:hypothetical protein